MNKLQDGETHFATLLTITAGGDGDPARPGAAARGGEGELSSAWHPSEADDHRQTLNPIHAQVYPLKPKIQIRNPSSEIENHEFPTLKCLAPVQGLPAQATHSRKLKPQTRNPETKAREPEPETRGGENLLGTVLGCRPLQATRHPQPETRITQPETRNSKHATRTLKPGTPQVSIRLK